MWKLNLAKNIIVIQKLYYRIHKINTVYNKINLHTLYSNLQSNIFILKILCEQNYKEKYLQAYYIIRIIHPRIYLLKVNATLMNRVLYKIMLL